MEINNDDSNKGTTEAMENVFHFYPVSAHDSAEGLPYAPIDWPQPGDKWRWKVGKRIAASGYFLDRYLYLPKRLQTISKGRTFASKLSVEQYVVRTFPGADVKAFFASFNWKVPARNLSEIKGTENGLQFLSVPTGETAEQSGSESQPGTRCCKAGNKLCSCLVESEEPPSRAMFCDICCSEPGFCRDCCCILCCKTINTDYGGYSFIKCEASINEGVICGHIAHIECGLRYYMAGTGGSVGLDAEYYCRRCDARTNLLSHVTKLLQTCEFIDSGDVIEKILNVGTRVLLGSQRISAKRLLRQIELAKGKLKSRTCLEDVWKVEDISSVTPGASSDHGHDASDYANKEPFDTKKVSEFFYPMSL